MDFNSNKALVGVVVTVASSVVSILCAILIPTNPQVKDQLIQAISIITPVVIGGIAWIHHSHANHKTAVQVATITASPAPAGPTPALPQRLAS